MLLSVIVPAYNEIEFIDEILRKVKETPYEKEIIVVDDCSTDGTREYLGNQEGIITIFQEKNPGADDWEGEVDHAAIWSRALSSREVRRLHEQPPWMVG